MLINIRFSEVNVCLIRRQSPLVSPSHVRLRLAGMPLAVGFRVYGLNLCICPFFFECKHTDSQMDMNSQALVPPVKSAQVPIIDLLDGEEAAAEAVRQACTRFGFFSSKH